MRVESLLGLARVTLQLLNRISEHLPQIVHLVQCVIQGFFDAGRLDWNEIEVLRNGHEPIWNENGGRIPVPYALFQHVEALDEEIGELEDNPLGLVLYQLRLLITIAVLAFLVPLTLSCAGLEVGELLCSLVGGGAGAAVQG